MSKLSAIIASIVGAFIFAVIWAFICSWPMIPMIIAYPLAISIGWAAAVGISLGNMPFSKIIAILIAVLAMMFGSMLSSGFRITDMATEASNDEEIVEMVQSHYVYKKVTGKGIFTITSQDDELMMSPAEDVTPTAEEIEKIDIQLDKLPKKLNRGEQAALVKKFFKEEWTLEDRAMEAFAFPYIIFLGIACFGAWKFSENE